MTQKERAVQRALGLENLYSLQVETYIGDSTWGMSVAVRGVDMRDACDELFKKMRQMTDEQRHIVMLGWHQEWCDFKELYEEPDADKIWETFWDTPINSVSVVWKHSFEELDYEDTESRPLDDFISMFKE